MRLLCPLTALTYKYQNLKSEGPPALLGGLCLGLELPYSVPCAVSAARIGPELL